MAILETSIVIDLLKGNESAVKIYDELEQREMVLFVAAPTIMELWIGALMSKWPEAEKEKINTFTRGVEVLPLDDRAARKAAEITHFLRKTGSQIQIQDVMIAAIAATACEAVVTRDSDFARIPGLIVLKY